MSISAIEAELILAAESLRATLSVYFPGTPGLDGRDLKERNLTAHFSSVLLESGFYVWHEALVSPARPYDSLDLLALSRDCSYLIKGEAKRIYKPEKFQEVRDDIVKMDAFTPFGEYAKRLPAKQFSVLLLSCWAPEGDRFPRKWLGEQFPEYGTLWSAFADEFVPGKWARGGQQVFADGQNKLWFLWAIRNDSSEGE